MEKINGKLGLKYHKVEDQGYFVQVLLGQPAISDGRIQPGDKITAVNNVQVSNLPRGEVVKLFQMKQKVKISLNRDMPT